MNPVTLSFDLKFRQPVLGKEREEIAQLVHRELLVGAAREVLLMAPLAALTVARL